MVAGSTQNFQRYSSSRHSWVYESMNWLHWLSTGSGRCQFLHKHQMLTQGKFGAPSLWLGCHSCQGYLGKQLSRWEISDQKQSFGCLSQKINHTLLQRNACYVAFSARLLSLVHIFGFLYDNSMNDVGRSGICWWFRLIPHQKTSLDADHQRRWREGVCPVVVRHLCPSPPQEGDGDKKVVEFVETRFCSFECKILTGIEMIRLILRSFLMVQVGPCNFPEFSTLGHTRSHSDILPRQRRILPFARRNWHVTRCHLVGIVFANYVTWLYSGCLTEHLLVTTEYLVLQPSTRFWTPSTFVITSSTWCYLVILGFTRYHSVSLSNTRCY